MTSTTDALNHMATFEYDSVGNLVATVDPLGNRIGRTYDAVSRLIMVKTRRGPSRALPTMPWIGSSRWSMPWVE